MGLSSTNTSTIEGLQVMDPDLPYLASEAAVDIDNLIDRSSEDLNAILRLANKLKNSIEVEDLSKPPKSLMDPITLTIVGEAFTASRADASSDVNNLLNETKKIAGVLANATGQSEPELINARDFCIALSKATMAYTISISDLQPSHPFRHFR